MQTIIKNKKIGSYGFIWRVVMDYNGESKLYKLQRFSKEYGTWFDVKVSQNDQELIKMYNDLKP